MPDLGKNPIGCRSIVKGTVKNLSLSQALIPSRAIRRKIVIHFIASIQVKENHLGEFIKIFKANVPHVLREKGCLGYEPTQYFPTGLPIQEVDKGTITIVEKWASMEDLKTHLTSPHMLDYKEKTKEMVKKLSVKVLEPL